MYASTTLYEIDTLRISMDAAIERFKQRILPRLQEVPGYLGNIVLDTPEGKGVLVCFWRSEADATNALTSGFFQAQVEDFVMLLRQPPGREQYRVAFYEFEEPLPSSAPEGVVQGGRT